MRNKAQTEILGLVVIVLILSVAMLFIYFFSIRGGSKEAVVYDEKSFADQTVSAILQTQTMCRKLDVIDLIKLCVNGNNWGTTQECTLEGREVQPCEFVENIINISLSKSLGLLNKEYIFSVFDNQNNRIINVNSIEECRIGAIVGSFPIYSRFTGDILTQLEICEHG